MKNYQVSGWTDMGTFETVVFMAHSIKEAKIIATENGLYPTKIRPIRIHPRQTLSACLK